MTLHRTPRFDQALDRMEQSDAHCFITGKAGTGKSTLLQYFRETTSKRAVVLAPTGVAAVNIRGQTIHSFFRFKPDITLEKTRGIARKIARTEPDLYRDLDTIVLDEISMVRVDLFECIDEFLRIVRDRPAQPFGGVQMVLIGDLYQLPPVITSAEREHFAAKYPGPYFFHAPVYAQMRVEIIELDTIYRQTDPQFIALLGAVRTNRLRGDDLHALNRRYVADATSDGATITLTAMNEPATRINDERLAALPGTARTYTGRTSGEFKRDALPTDMDLTLKVRAQVMLVNNDPDGRWVNGTIGTVRALPVHKEWIEVDLEDGSTEVVEPYTWEMLQYEHDATQHVLTSRAAGKFTQFPLKLAWAITIHKSQGKTFDRVVIDIGRGTFASGQMYVALSRCRTLDGITLRQRILPQHVRVDPRVVNFLGQSARAEAGAAPVDDIVQQLRGAIADEVSVEMTYLKSPDDPSTRIVRPIAVGDMEFKGNPFLGLRAWCHRSGDERTFRVDRIVKLTPVAID